MKMETFGAHHVRPLDVPAANVAAALEKLMNVKGLSLTERASVIQLPQNMNTHECNYSLDEVKEIPNVLYRNIDMTGIKEMRVVKIVIHRSLEPAKNAIYRHADKFTGIAGKRNTLRHVLFVRLSKEELGTSRVVKFHDNEKEDTFPTQDESYVSTSFIRGVHGQKVPVSLSPLLSLSLSLFFSLFFFFFDFISTFQSFKCSTFPTFYF